MKKNLKRALAVLLCVALVASISCISAFAAVDFTDSADGYYDVVYKKDYVVSPGVSESEIVLNNSDGAGRRQVLHVMEADPKNENVGILPHYSNMENPNDESKWKVISTTKHAQQAVDAGYNVVGAMNTALSWDTDQPLGKYVVDGVVWRGDDDYVSCQTYLAVKQDGTADLRAASEPLEADDYEVIGLNFGFMVKDGVNVAGSESHTAGDPRSVIGIKADGTIVMMECDGRAAPYADGLTPYEIAEVMISLGCVEACNGDGGGSSAFLSKREGEDALSKRSRDSDGIERETTMALLIVNKAQATDTFDHASLAPEHDSVTPGSEVAVNAIGVSAAGTPAEIPDDIAWQLADASFGEVNNGVFTSNGKQGDAVVQMTVPSTLPDDTIVFSNNKNFENAYIYCWKDGTDLSNNWPGVPMEKYDTSSYGEQRYIFHMPAEYDRYIIHDGKGTQSQNIVFSGKTGVYLDGDNNNGAFYGLRDIVGEATVHVVVPDRIEFEQNQMTIPYGKKANLSLNAYKGYDEVAIKPSDINFVFSEPAIGNLDGFLFTAADEESATVSSSNVTATLVFDDAVTAQASITLGKGSEVIFDFEGENDLNDWSYYDYNVTKPSGNKPRNEMISIADKNTGKVRNGDHSLAVLVDTTNAYQAGWIQYRLFYTGDYFEREGAIKLGFWAWIPEEAHADEIDIKVTRKTADGSIKGSAKEVNNPDYAVNEQDEAGWHYFTYSFTEPTVFFGATEGSSTSLLFQFYNYKQMWQNDTAMNIKNDQGKFTYFIDDITLEYSTAADDTTPPTFSNLCYTGANDPVALNKGDTITSGTPSFMVNVAEDNTLPTAVGLNTDSVKAYIDGNETPITIDRNGLATTDQLALNDGTHTIKFYAEDNNGNPASIVREFTVNAGSDIPNVTLQPHDPSQTNLPFDSLYYLDIVASDISAVDSVSMKIDLNNASKWELDHMTVADGFSATYSITEFDNTATINITRDGANGRSAVLASLPVRVWSTDNIENLNGEAKRIWVTAKTKQALLTTTDGEEIPCGSSIIETPTERGLGRYDSPNYPETVHTHNPVDVDDVAATCTEPGFTGRTYCADCDSIVDWGTEVPATGHTYEVIDGVLKCKDCGELYNGVYDVDGKYYIDGVLAQDWQTIDGKKYYFTDGVAATGQIIINNKLYTFDENGVYQEDEYFTGPFFEEAAGKWRFFDHNDAVTGFVQYEGDWYFYLNSYYAATGTQVLSGRNYKFEGEQGKCIGAWVEEEAGKKFYFNVHYYKNTWAEIEGDTYYFDNAGHCYTGKVAPAHKGQYLGAYEFDEDGKFIGNITGVFQDARTGDYFYAEDGVLFNGGLLKWDNNYYFARNNYKLATTEWYVDADKTNNLKPKGMYQFGEDAKMILENGIVQNADGSYSYYVDGVQQAGIGLIEVDGDYYYVRSNGKLATTEWYVDADKTNNLKPKGMYQFGEDGKMILENGIIQNADGSYSYYVDGVQQAGLGLIKVDDDYYYVRSNGKLATTEWYVGNNDYGFSKGVYVFGADGKMVLLNGIVQNADGSYSYYVDGVPQSGLGLIKVDDDYYYVRSNGKLATTDWYVGNNGYDVPAGTYKFGADGKMELLNGVQYIGGTWKYYVDNVQQYGLGIIEYEGDYYYVRSNGNLVVDNDWYVDKNDLGVSVGTHHFGEDGKMAMAD